MKNIFALLLAFLFISCDDEDSSTPCQLSEKDEDMACIEIYQPVCGCNNRHIQIHVMLGEMVCHPGRKVSVQVNLLVTFGLFFTSSKFNLY